MYHALTQPRWPLPLPCSCSLSLVSWPTWPWDPQKLWGTDSHSPRSALSPETRLSRIGWAFWRRWSWSRWGRSAVQCTHEVLLKIIIRFITSFHFRPFWGDVNFARSASVQWFPKFRDFLLDYVLCTSEGSVGVGDDLVGVLLQEALRLELGRVGEELRLVVARSDRQLDRGALLDQHAGSNLMRQVGGFRKSLSLISWVL